MDSCPCACHQRRRWLTLIDTEWTKTHLQAKGWKHHPFDHNLSILGAVAAINCIIVGVELCDIGGSNAPWLDTRWRRPRTSGKRLQSRRVLQPSRGVGFSRIEGGARAGEAGGLGEPNFPPASGRRFQVPAGVGGTDRQLANLSVPETWPSQGKRRRRDRAAVIERHRHMGTESARALRTRVKS